ncbi:TraX family protein [Halomonas denitrificans]|uniref:TraX family protein n=1 Tax=Halomonas denitrificans TaxID=370769 RepID=UPI001C998819|nr:TraX family protein [Halomonas denitrificans]MBY5967458.1 conjugal transfer protein TraX [Halomonas denitrificans]
MNLATNAGYAARPSSAWTGWGQWIALITMTLDHVARYLATDAWHMGWIDSSVGRIAFPLFAGMVAWHGLFNTRDPLRYARRVMVIGLLAQLPYQLMPREAIFQLNICFTLALGLMAGHWLEQLTRRQDGGELGYPRLALETLGIALAWYFAGFWVEYGHQGLLLVPFFMLAIGQLHRADDDIPSRLLAVAGCLPLLAVAGLMNSSDMAKSVTVATVLLVLLLAAGASRLVRAPSVTMPRKMWLAWYPAHFAVIAAILLWNGNAQIL